MQSGAERVMKRMSLLDTVVIQQFHRHLHNSTIHQIAAFALALHLEQKLLLNIPFYMRTSSRHKT